MEWNDDLEKELEKLLSTEEKEEAPEANISLCRYCGHIKPRILAGKYGNSRNKRWKDDKGSLWVGRRCPDCVRSNMKKRMANGRSLGKLFKEKK